jgi:hypothetical protein
MAILTTIRALINTWKKAPRNPKKYLSQQKDRREDSQGGRYAYRTL